ncbi:hypothetical protein ACOKM5_37635 [Streptomyces sp. BH097]
MQRASETEFHSVESSITLYAGLAPWAIGHLVHMGVASDSDDDRDYGI